MSQIIDRRPTSKHKSAVNRQRFIKRYKKQIKSAISDAITGRSITDINQGESISIPKKDLQEPQFQHGEGGVYETVHPGNIDFAKGDKIKRPPKNPSKNGSDASPEGEGEDAFTFELSKEEFLDLFFEDLCLPNLVKKKLRQINSYQWVRAGHTPTGVPTNINVKRSLTQAIGRRLALKAPNVRKLKEQQEKLKKLEKNPNDKPNETSELKKEIEKLKKRIKRIPFIDTIDLRYNHRIKQPMPSTQAVMFCIMDVSGSMDEEKKEIAKRFFILLYLFLTRAYQKIEIVFIRHHTSAKEVDEETFFYSRETGGTVVSSALELTATIIKKRYDPNQWNIYCAQGSDGDNWMNDSPICQKILHDEIMPIVQYFAYVEILPRQHQSLWETYLKVAEDYSNFAMKSIENQKEIYPVFRNLFKKEVAHGK